MCSICIFIIFTGGSNYTQTLLNMCQNTKTFTNSKEKIFQFQFEFEIQAKTRCFGNCLVLSPVIFKYGNDDDDDNDVADNHNDVDTAAAATDIGVSFTYFMHALTVSTQQHNPLSKSCNLC